MASIGHAAVGFALTRFAARRTARTLALFAAVALAPDLDVIGFGFGVPYASDFGHRGATHSLFVAVVIAAIVGIATHSVRWATLIAVALASHGILDAMTTGGLGPALFWPFDNARVFLPWRPIPVAPIGPAILSPRGLKLMAFEALLFLPCWIIAVWPRRRASR